MKPAQTRAKARTMFVQSRLSLVVIAQQLGVSRATASRWKKAALQEGDDWDVARSAAVMAGQGHEKMVSDAVEGFAEMFQTTMSQLRTNEDMKPEDRVKLMASLADAFNKMMGAAGRASPKLSALAVATDVIQRLADFIRERFPHHGQAFEEVLEPFALALSRDLSE
ncbi:hypothetical protein AN189_13030 [Loktanella sp. 3ANDIMAR09]|uniref:DUF1804 family protein n=1 Tax=Loktanella sp. 3ANDIMAR09 TaxID=1225657 RepID=UPI0006F2F838|nr:DUF1804 family protein [Loktanella sp. 3ANDIMAR09]KQI67990.1 hypothetical protein AN189_13030 [Loktanella sp. 3ANDIMAR09]